MHCGQMQKVRQAKEETISHTFARWCDPWMKKRVNSTAELS